MAESDNQPPPQSRPAWSVDVNPDPGPPPPDAEPVPPRPALPSDEVPEWVAQHEVTPGSPTSPASPASPASPSSPRPEPETRTMLLPPDPMPPAPLPPAPATDDWAARPAASGWQQPSSAGGWQRLGTQQPTAPVSDWQQPSSAPPPYAPERPVPASPAEPAEPDTVEPEAAEDEAAEAEPKEPEAVESEPVEDEAAGAEPDTVEPEPSEPEAVEPAEPVEPVEPVETAEASVPEQAPPVPAPPEPTPPEPTAPEPAAAPAEPTSAVAESQAPPPVAPEPPEPPEPPSQPAPPAPRTPHQQQYVAAQPSHYRPPYANQPQLPAYPPPGPPPQPPTPPGPPGSAAELTSSALLRQQSVVPTHGWRKVLHRLTSGALNPGLSRRDQEMNALLDRVRTQVRGCHRIAVVSLKGGIGKTTTTACLGLLLAHYRGDRVVAIDANPDAGTLAERLTGDVEISVRDLLDNIRDIQTFTEVSAYTTLADRLQVLASDQEPEVSLEFDEARYREVCGLLARFYNVVLTDSGTGLLHSAMAGTLSMADSLVVVSAPSVDGASRAAKTLDWLVAHGYHDLVSRCVAVIQSVRPNTGGEGTVDMTVLRNHFAARCRAVLEIPYDPHLVTGGLIRVDQLKPATRKAYLELAAAVGDGFALH